ncbi:hypothetical protein Taro_037349 [Colocasia esculenta]|uniref:Uncharacterized protein n=1 Tax=Colocasia esculenta TaxID=4460 RepID=A0A843WAW6_COLES|nr:hypothetical protein [Colocasia esculenta]
MDALQGRGFARFVGEGLWSVGARRRRVANLREGPLRLDLHLEPTCFPPRGCDCSVVEALKKGASVCCTLVRRHLWCRHPGGDTSMRRLQELLKVIASMSPPWWRHGGRRLLPVFPVLVPVSVQEH